MLRCTVCCGPGTCMRGHIGNRVGFIIDDHHYQFRHNSHAFANPRGRKGKCPQPCSRCVSLRAHVCPVWACLWLMRLSVHGRMGTWCAGVLCQRACAGPINLKFLHNAPFFQNGAKSGFEMCFGLSTLGAGAKSRLESRIKRFTPHCVCMCTMAP